MADDNAKRELLSYLQAAREALVWKLEGLSEYDARRPLVYSGTNLLGLLKHVSLMEAVYLGATFGRSVPHEGWLVLDFDQPLCDMSADADEPRERIVEYYKRVWANSDGTVSALALDATGNVPHWPEDRRKVTLHHMLIRMISETNRHAGHADIVRELIDDSIGVRKDNRFVPSDDPAWYAAYRERLEAVARIVEGSTRDH